MAQNSGKSIKSKDDFEKEEEEKEKAKLEMAYQERQERIRESLALKQDYRNLNLTHKIIVFAMFGMMVFFVGLLFLSYFPAFSGLINEGMLSFFQ